jgi:X-Pro dipeptidyl-peptidase
MRRWILAAATVCAIAAATGAAQAADPPTIVIGADGETAPVFSYANAIRERVFIPVPGVDQDADGVTDEIAIDIVRPQETNAGLKVPAIIDPSPYYTSLGRGNESQFLHTTADGIADRIPLFGDNFFVPRGYAYIAAQADGTAFSTGCPLHGGPGDVKGFKTVIDWLMGRVPGHDKNGNPVAATWDSGKNAMIGKSYDGTFANAVAATGVDGLTTIVPESAISDWYDYSRMGGIRFNTHYPASLSSTIVQNQSATQLGVVPPSHLAACLASRNAMSAADGDTDGDVNPFWQDRNYDLNVANVHAAVFATHGLNDDNVRPNHLSQWWAGLTANNVPRKLWLAQTGHVDPFDYRRSVWVDTLHRWFDFWLQGVPNGIMSEPQVDIETGPGVWETQPSWPLPGTQPVNAFLQAGAAGTPGRLGPIAGGLAGTQTFTGANQSETNYLSLTGPLTSRLLFLSPPLTQDLRISGTPVVDIHASLNKTQTNLTAFLVDYGGGVQRVRGGSDGVTNTTTRTCWGESTATDSACYLEVNEVVQTPTQWRVSKGILDSSNRDSLTSGGGLPATIGQTYDFNWPLLPNDFTFVAGHRVGIVLGGDFSGFQSVVGTANTTITVDTKGSKIVLPVVGGAAAATASGIFAGADTTAPTLHLPAADVTQEATGPTTPVSYTVTATDDVDAAPTVACSPASGSSFAVGTTKVDCTATDSSGNVSTGSFNVVVTDTTAPTIAPTADVTTEATGPSGATAAYTTPTANDLVDGAVAVTCTPASGSVFALGPTTVTCTATDHAGNTGHSTFVVHVVDTTAPSLTVPAAISADATSPTGVVVTWTTSATDTVDPSPTVACTPPSGSFLAIGDTTVSCTATDASGNTSAPKTFTVHVRGASEELTNLEALVHSFGLAPALEANLEGWLTQAETLLGRGKSACTQYDWFIKQVIQYVAGTAPKLTVAQGRALAAAASALEGASGCRNPNSPVPAAEQSLIGLIGTITGMGLADPEETILTNQVRTVAKNLVDGTAVCSSIGDLTTRIAGDSGKNNRLTAAQANQLLAVVAQVSFSVGCSGGGEL